MITLLILLLIIIMVLFVMIFAGVFGSWFIIPLLLIAGDIFIAVLILRKIFGRK